MKRLICCIILSLLTVWTNLWAQHHIKVEINPKDSTKLYIYPIYFADKDTLKFKSTSAKAYLSDLALQRRQKYGINVTIEDFPIKMEYIDILRKQKNVEVLKWSKWLNCAIIRTPDTNAYYEIMKLPFVVPKPVPKPKSYQPIQIVKEQVKEKKLKKKSPYNYGFAANQVKMINIDKLHAIGYDGKNVKIAVLDGGFLRVDKVPAFDSLRKDKRILGYYDFVDMDTTIFEKGDHGREVLSTIASLINGQIVGTAPKASFYLFVTEDGASETQLEEYNYVIACELADSLGVDIIHASLGYSKFDTVKLSYTLEQMDGNTAISTIGADIAASKGIIVITSAGNEGDELWGKITAPADGDSVICVGALNPDGSIASFSSRGPTADGRIVPTVCAQGVNVVVYGRHSIKFSNGTSFSGPIVAGGVACLLQAFPNAKFSDIYYSLASTASKADSPDNDYGFGKADFYKAYLVLKKKFDKK